ncbi:MAG: UDP-N-acetylglucosamine--LPS N-acetylglucosamine transferase [Acaryochloris sp. RU_4_1]|nr:UDP-N-acetylglucosamine--LPS N-acetylglucosamine transferase [Acaryochloris sp. RU_4_1]NJR55002.1 UDP-N-acetylglucosamine--LPS N-acetylglucosamine transferase [Acaryochloris sp. CRU_2_0]
MTKVLILYSSLGSGHVSAAKALSDAFSQFPDVEVRAEDALAYANALYRRVVTEAYEQLSERMPQLYKAFYEGSDVGELEKSLDNNLTWAKLERPFFRQLGALLAEADPDVIVCVQQIPSRLLQLVEDQQATGRPQYVVITDAIAHSTWINYGVSGYFLPNDLSRNFLLQRGVQPDILHVTGIPINLEIQHQKSQVGMRSHLNLPVDGILIALMGGGLNPRRVSRLVQDLLAYGGFDTLVIAAGRNQNLLDALAGIDSNEQTTLRKLGMIDYIDDLIVASDLIITKAGGLITSEILARGKPMVLVDPIPGQEEQNADVIEAAGAGVQLRLLEMVAPALSYLLHHPERLAAMRQAALTLGRPSAALAIADYIVQHWQADAHQLKTRQLPGKKTDAQ